jgi:branched-chain amino acid transport system substrate-binding protein
MKRSWWLILSVIVIASIAVALWVLRDRSEDTPDVVKIGGIFDLTGATSDVGIPYANGVRDSVEFINAQGGINGRKINLIDEDYGYNIERAQALYDRLVNEEKVLVIMGWGTGDTEAMRSRIAADKIPFMSASYAEGLTVIQEAPYNFLIGVTYSDQMRIALQYIYDQWSDDSRPPRVAFVYNDTGFGLSPIQDGRDYAARLGIEVVDEEIVSLSAIDVTEEMRALAEAAPDYIIVQETTASASVIALAAHDLELPAQIIYLNWGADEKLIKLSGEAAEGVLGTVPFAFITEDVPGMDDIRAFNQERGVEASTLNIRYIQGWVTMQVMAEGIRRAGDNLSGGDIRQGLESLSSLDTGGITAPITFSSTSHKGANALRIYQVRNGQWEPITDYIQPRP